MTESGREHTCQPVAVPPDMASQVEGYLWARDQVGESGGAVYRLYGKAAASDLYLKVGAGTVADDIAGEAARLRWLGLHVPVPEVRTFVREAGNAWLLMTALPGRTAYQMLEENPGDGGQVVDAIAAFLRRLHAIPIGDCPFDSSHASRLIHARARIEAGLVDVDDFDEGRAGWSAERVWDEIEALLPLASDRVVTHGDYSLDNLLMLDGEVVGCIDVGRAGCADRYQDLAILWNCLGEFGAPMQARLFSQYGMEQPDQRRMDFHLLLDELF